MTVYRTAELAGFDLSLVEATLRFTYEERALQHQEALNLALELERIGLELREQKELPA